MLKSEVAEALKRFEKHIQKEGRKILTQQGHVDTKKLYNIKFVTTKVMPNSISIYFDLGTYGEYVDQGVKGKESSLKAPNSPYKFKDKKPPMKPLSEWEKRKGIRFRDVKGRYKKGNYESVGFWLQSLIYKTGMKPSLFFTKPFESAYKNLPDELADKYGLDAIDLIKDIIRQP